MSSVSPMCLNRPSHATTSAPTTAPAPENAIMCAVSADVAVEDLAREDRQERQQRQSEERRQRTRAPSAR